MTKIRKVKECSRYEIIGDLGISGADIAKDSNGEWVLMNINNNVHITSRGAIKIAAKLVTLNQKEELKNA